MESNSDCNQLIENSFPFEFETFDFLSKTISNEEQIVFGLKSVRIRITCFDVNHNYFIFGSNVGIVYLFKRHVLSQQLFKCRLISSAIRLIKLITDDLLAYVTDSGVYVINRLNHQFLYGWKCPSKALITSLQTFKSSNDQKILLISGDSDGFVRFHDMIECKQNIIYNENGFEIIQIEFIDKQTLLISSTHKTVIIQIDLLNVNKLKVIQIGKNERKTFDKFGAIYSFKSNTIYGSRPSLHLIKAELNGNVIETIRINHIKSTQFPETLKEFSKPINGKIHHKLGILKLFCSDEYIISSNDSDLLIIRTDGQFCLKEKIAKLIDVKIVETNTNEAFLLLESKLIIRIQNRHLSHIENSSEFEGSSDYERSSDDKNSDTKRSNDSLLFLSEEMKKAFDFKAIQLKFTEKYNQLSTSIISTIDSTLLKTDKDVFVTPEYDKSFNENGSTSPTKELPELVTPLVIPRKGKRKPNVKNIDNNQTNNAEIDLQDSEELIPTIDENLEKSANKELSSVESLIKTTDLVNGNELENIDLLNENRLQMILSAYKEGNNKLDIDSQLESNQTFEYTFEYNESEVKPFYSTDNTGIETVLTQTNTDISEEMPKETESEVKFIEHKWEQVLSFTEFSKKSINNEILLLCASGYNSCTEIGLVWFISKNQNSVFYYPSLDPLKIPKGYAVQIICATYELYVLNNSGNIFKREGMDATKPIGTKWTNIKMNKSKSKLTAFSLNPKDSIIWCCDANGETWTHQTKDQKWTFINDFSSHSIEMKKVSVSSNDSTIVWGIDKFGKIFVRIFDTSGEQHKHICGDLWLLIDGVLANDIVVDCYNYVVIVVEGSKLLRRNAKIDPNDSNCYTDWQQINTPDIENDSIGSISVTESNDIWILTAKGSVWRTINPLKKNFNEVDLDWLLI